MAPPPTRRRRRSRQTQRNFFEHVRDVRRDWTSVQPAFFLALLALLIVGPALALGAVKLGALLAFASLSFLSVFTLGRSGSVTTFPGGLCLMVALYCVLQSIPLPLSWVEGAAPHNAEVWRESLRLVDGHAPSRAPLSIDPGASLREALTWAFYAAVLLVTSRVTRRHGTTPALAIVYFSALCVALVTLAHGILGAEQVYGFYERSFLGAQWALSPLINANNLAGYLNLGIFCGLALVLRAKSVEQRLGLSLGILLMLTLSLTSGSRGAVGTLALGLAGAGLLYALRRHKRDRNERSIDFGLVVTTILFAGAAALLVMPASALSGLGDKNVDKIHMIRWAAPLIEDHPWFGVGAGAFESGFLPYQARDDGALWTHPENFLMGWFAELGIPVTLLLLSALAYFGWHLRKQNSTPTRVIAAMAVALWFFHNLFDLAITVPGVFVAVVVLIGALAEPAAKMTRTAEPSRPSASARWTPLMVGCTGIALLFAVSTFGRQTTSDDRKALHESLASVNLRDAGARNQFLRDLNAAIRRHPGDAYLFRLGAVFHATTGEASTLRWIGRSLDRDMRSASTHFLLARDLARRGALSQALLHLRLTAERSSHLVPSIAKEAVTWTTEERLLRKMVPEGPLGSKVLEEIAKALSRESHADLRERFLLDAISRNGQNPHARIILVEDLLGRSKQEPERCVNRRPTCMDELRKQFEALAVAPDVDATTASRILRLQAQSTALSGNATQAVRSLLDHCPRTEPSCLGDAVMLSARHGLPLEDPAQHYLALACPGDNDCINARRLLGNQYASKKDFRTALVHFKEAATLSNTAGDYLKAINAALQAGLDPEVHRLLKAIERATPPPTGSERERAAKLGEQADAKARNQMLPGLPKP